MLGVIPDKPSEDGFIRYEIARPCDICTLLRPWRTKKEAEMLTYRGYCGIQEKV